MRKVLSIICLTLVGCGFSNSNVRTRTVIEDDDGTKMRRRVVTQEGDASTVSAGLPIGAGYGGYDPYGGYVGYGYNPYGSNVVMGGRPDVQLDTPIVYSTTTVVTGGESGSGSGGSPAKDTEQDKRLDRVERRTQDLRDVELRQECEKPENKDKPACLDLNKPKGGK